MSLSILSSTWGEKVGYVFIPRKKGEVWEEGKAYKYPDEMADIKDFIISSAKDKWDIYWCPLVFAENRRIKDNVLPQQSLLWADLDLVDPLSLDGFKPSIAWKSSNDRFQALWFLDKDYSIDYVESLNKALTYKIGADKGGWDITQVLRIPGSLNYKYTPPQKGSVLWAERRVFDAKGVAESVMPPVEKPSAKAYDLEALLNGWEIPLRIQKLLNVKEGDVKVGERSERLWEIETALLQAGLPVLSVVDIIRLCPWNKFKGRKSEEEQIYNEVLKADKYVKINKKSEVIVSSEEKIEDTSWAIPFSKFISTHIEPPVWLVDNIWQKNTYGMIAGEPKTYKSTIATDLALSVASGTAFMNTFNVNQSGGVLYIQEENNAQTVQDRVLKVAASKGLATATSDGWQLHSDLPIFFSNNCGINLSKPDSRTLIENTIKEVKPLLIILDPLYMMFGGVDENSAQEVGEVLRWITHLRNEYNTSILICHHYNKGNSNTRAGQRVRGSSAFHAWVESALYIKATTELYTVKLEREFRAFPSSAELTFRIEMDAPGKSMYLPQLIDSTDAGFSAVAEEKIEEVYDLISKKDRTDEDLKAVTTLSPAKLKTILNTLIEDGRVTKTSHRGKKPVYSMKEV